MIKSKKGFMSKKILVIVLIIFAVVAVFVGGYLLWQKNKEPEKYTGPVEKIVIGNLGEYSILNLVAKDQGYFKENGLDAEIKEYPSGPPAVVDLLAGKVDVTIAGEFVGVSYIFTNNNLRILANTSKEKVVQVVARKDKGINNPANLKGKKIGVTRKSSGEIFLGRFLISNNMSFSDVDIINLSPSEMTDQISKGQIDAVVTFEPNPYNIEKILGDNAIVWSAQGEQNTYATLYSTDEFIKNHPQIIERYLQSLIQAEQYVKNHDTEAKAILAKAMNYDDSYISYIWPKISFSLNLEQELLLTMEDEARWAIENKIIDQTKVPNYLNFIYFDALTKIKPEAVTAIY